MKSPCASAIVWWVAAAAGLSPAADPATFSHRLNASEELHRQGAYAEAERLLLALLAEADGAGTRDPRKLTVLNNLGSVYHSMSKYLQAEQCYRRAIEIGKAAGTDASESHFQSTVNLACLYIDTGQYQKADRLGLHILAESRPMARRRDAGFARLLATLGALEFSQGSLAAAERYAGEALKIWQQLRPNGVETIEVLSNMGILYLEMGRNAEARASFQRALAIADAALPADDPARVRLWINAGTFHAVVDGRAAAEPFYRKALNLAQEKLGNEHPVVGTILSSYAVLLESAGRNAQAAEYRRRAQSIQLAVEQTDPRRHTVDVRDLQRGK